MSSNCRSVSLSMRLKNLEIVGWDARLFFSRMAPKTGSEVNSSAQSSSKYAAIIWYIICIRFSSSLWIRIDLSLVLNLFLISLVKPIFAANSFIRRSPASEDKSPPSKLILILVLLSKLTVFKISIERPFLWFLFGLVT